MKPGFLLNAVVLGTLGLAACGAIDADRQDAAFADHADVRIVTTPETILDQIPVVTLDAPPSLIVGSALGSDEQLLHRIAGVARLPNGHIVVANGGNTDVRWYDSSGRFVRSAGRFGSGPGEFASFMLTLQTLDPDTLIIHDMVAGRMTYFAFDGELLGTRSLPDRLSGFVGLVAGNRAVVAAPETETRTVPSLGTVHRPFFVRTIDLDTGAPDTIVELEAAPELWHQRGERIIISRVPFTVYPAVAAGESRIAIVDGRSYEVRLYDGDGHLSAIHRLGLDPSPVRPGEYREAVEAEINAGPEADHADLARLFRSAPMPQTVPTFDAVMLDARGSVWAGHYPAPRDTFKTWTVFDSSGDAIFRVRTPIGLRLRHVTDDLLLGTYIDDSGVEYVHGYKLDLPVIGGVSAGSPP
ncbi:MAG TPA: 6-bladed beta-propeller [Longimicrobiales bacterium]|nr:6-bladed beta-propeller [Longimicrobiales bacterium]